MKVRVSGDGEMPLTAEDRNAQRGGTHMTNEEQCIALTIDIDDRIKALLDHLAETPDLPVTSLIPRMAEAITATGHLAYAVSILKGKMLQ